MSEYLSLKSMHQLISFYAQYQFIHTSFIAFLAFLSSPQSNDNIAVNALPAALGRVEELKFDLLNISDLFFSQPPAVSTVNASYICESRVVDSCSLSDDVDGCSTNFTEVS